MYTLQPNERKVTETELQQIWDRLRKERCIYNGCTNVELKKKYGNNVRHVAGFGWVVRTEQVMPDLPFATLWKHSS
jgi:hypothetical protein